jgi:hypothetical protein
LLLDHCVPRRFGRLLLPHEVQTAAQVGFDAPKNGALLRAASAAGFDAMITVDQGIAFHQNLTALPIGVILLMAPNNEGNSSAVRNSVTRTQPGLRHPNRLGTYSAWAGPSRSGLNFGRSSGPRCAAC